MMAGSSVEMLRWVTGHCLKQVREVYPHVVEHIDTQTQAQLLLCVDLSLIHSLSCRRTVTLITASS
jgi:hypothetical protein